MSDPNTDQSESVDISTDDENGQATSHTTVVEDGKTIVDRTDGPEQISAASS